MGSERLRKLLLKSPHFRGFIGIFFAALIAPDPEGAIQSGRRHVDICFAEGDFMPKKNILSNMKPVVLADYHPAIIAIFPHACTLQAMLMIGRG
jgi:hypothetical protein